MKLRARLVGDRLDRRVQELGRKHEDQAAAEDRFLDRPVTGPEAERKEDHEEIGFETERSLVAPRGAKTLHRPDEGLVDLLRTPWLGARHRSPLAAARQI